MTVPVIEAQNINKTTLDNAVNDVLATMSYATIDQVLGIADDVLIKRFCLLLATKLPAHSALFNLYTYKPLYGISSVTDQNSNMIKYDYDQRGRLKSEYTCYTRLHLRNVRYRYFSSRNNE